MCLHVVVCVCVDLCMLECAFIRMCVFKCVFMFACVCVHVHAFRCMIKDALNKQTIFFHQTIKYRRVCVCVCVYRYTFDSMFMRVC